VILVVTTLWKRPWRAIVGFARAGRNRQRSKLQCIVGPFGGTWTRITTPQGRFIVWNCELTVTNDGNRVNAPVKGTIAWKKRIAAFPTRLRIQVPDPIHPGYSMLNTVADLGPNDTARLTTEAFMSMQDDDDAHGKLSAKIEFTDRYNQKHRVRTTFLEHTFPVPPPGQCGSNTIKDGKTFTCDKPTGHPEVHSSGKPVPGSSSILVTTWDDSGPGSDFLVLK